jgi:hypothetical protein
MSHGTGIGKIFSTRKTRIFSARPEPGPTCEMLRSKAHGGRCGARRLVDKSDKFSNDPIILQMIKKYIKNSQRASARSRTAHYLSFVIRNMCTLCKYATVSLYFLIKERSTAMCQVSYKRRSKLVLTDLLITFFAKFFYLLHKRKGHLTHETKNNIKKHSNSPTGQLPNLHFLLVER